MLWLFGDGYCNALCVRIWDMDHGIWNADSILLPPLPGTWESAVHSGLASTDSGYDEAVKVPGTTLACVMLASTHKQWRLAKHLFLSCRRLRRLARLI